MIQVASQLTITAWKERKLIADAMGSMLHGAKRAGEDFKQKVQASLNQPAPPHSVPGEYPHTVTGRLRREITVRLDETRKEVIIKSGAPYAEYVERIRPYMLKAYLDHLEEIGMTAIKFAEEEFNRRNNGGKSWRQ